MSVRCCLSRMMMRHVWTVVSGPGGSLTAVGALTTFDSHNYALGLPVLAVGLEVLALWYVKHIRT